MENTFYCRSCGQEQSGHDAEQADFNCPQCGEQMTQKEHLAKAIKKASTRVTIFSALIIALVVAGFLLRPDNKDYRSPDIASPDDSGAKIVADLLADARSLNSKTPFMVDNSTQLDEIVVEGQKITYKNTLVKLTAEERARDNMFKKDIKQFLTEKYCGDKLVSKGLKAGIEYDHEYSGSDGTMLFTAYITYADCEALSSRK